MYHNFTVQNLPHKPIVEYYVLSLTLFISVIFNYYSNINFKSMKTYGTIRKLVLMLCEIRHNKWNISNLSWVFPVLRISGLIKVSNLHSTENKPHRNFQYLIGIHEMAPWWHCFCSIKNISYDFMSVLIIIHFFNKLVSLY